MLRESIFYGLDIKLLCGMVIKIIENVNRRVNINICKLNLKM